MHRDLANAWSEGGQNRQQHLPWSHCWLRGARFCSPSGGQAKLLSSLMEGLCSHTTSKEKCIEGDSTKHTFFKRRNPQDEDPPRWGVPADSAVFGLFSSLLPTHSLCPWCPDYFMKLILLFCTSMRGWVSWLRKPWNENQLGILVQTSLQHWMQLGRDQHYPSWCSLAPLSTEIGNLWGTHRAEGDRFTSHECNPETSTRQRSSTNASAK